MNNEKQLWLEYRATWEAFSRKLDELQHLVESEEREQAAAALRQLEIARLEHNRARDRLVVLLSERTVANEERRELAIAS